MADEIEIMEMDGPNARLAKDLFAGAAGGVAQVLIGQPFDIVKVRLQTTTQHKSALECATNIWSKEGPLAFYKGTLTPLIGIGACVSVQFGAFHAARRFFEGQNASKHGHTVATTAPATAKALSYTQFYAAGAFAGITNSVLSGPIEHVRIRLQTQPHVSHPSQRLYSGPLDCIRTLVNKAGVTGGLYRGQAVTLLREAQAYGVWFLTYEYLMNREIRSRGLKDRSQVEAWRLAFYGGLAGEMLWLGSYPLDVVKSKMQTDGLELAAAARNAADASRTGSFQAAHEGAQAVVKNFGLQQFPTMRSCFARIYAEDGFLGFWRGLGPTLLRAMPVSGATFFVAEMTLRAIS